MRLTDKTGFIFLWNESDKARRQVRLTYNEPGTTAVIDIPASGAIELPAGAAKILPLDLPLGRGVLHYSTSEVAGVHQLGDRLLLIVYGDPDTPGEISLQWPGRPLVLGDVVSKDWDAEHKVLTLDYYHKAQDQYLLVDDLQIAVLSRARRAASAARLGNEPPLTLCTGLEVSDAEATAEHAKATLHSPEGEAKITAALPVAPSQVTVDGKPVTFAYLAPSRVLEMEVTTASYEQEHEHSTLWNRISRGVLGGPPKLTPPFDRVFLLADSEAPATAWIPLGVLGRSPEAAGLHVGDFARLRTHLDPEGRTTLKLVGASDPTFVYVNGKLVIFDNDRPDREADVSSLLVSGENEIFLLVHLLPRVPGLSGLRRQERRLPSILLKGEKGDLTPDAWELSPGLAGEAAGWTAAKLPTDSWNSVHLGPWSEQGRRFEGMTGVGWYRVPFGLAPKDGWQIPYQLRLTVSGHAQLYLNGEKLATLLGSGSYSLSLPDSRLVHGGDNVLVLAVCDPAGKGGLDKIEITSDESRMTRARQLEVTF